MSLSPDERKLVTSKYKTTRIKILTFMWPFLRTHDPSLWDIFSSNDDECCRRLQGTKRNLPCRTLPDSWTSFVILDNSSCCLANWPLNLESEFGYALRASNDHEISWERSAQMAHRANLQLLAPADNPEQRVRQAGRLLASNDEEYRRTGQDENKLEQGNQLTNQLSRETVKVDTCRRALFDVRVAPEPTVEGPITLSEDKEIT